MGTQLTHILDLPLHKIAEECHTQCDTTTDHFVGRLLANPHDAGKNDFLTAHRGEYNGHKVTVIGEGDTTQSWVSFNFDGIGKNLLLSCQKHGDAQTLITLIRTDMPQEEANTVFQDICNALNHNQLMNISKRGISTGTNTFAISGYMS